ncbi:FAD-linked oxidase C-terminal domain-containing protein [Phaeobacter sp. NW0010-22]|uniref:FAD-binding oxidoreductase n=1 Tax=Phaeobacter sp. NW0010-22 TaxID=3135907 RepID=UPI0031037369
MIGAVAGNDVSLPLTHLPEFIEQATAKVAALAPLRANCFDHLGDGNLHFNFFSQKGETRDAYIHLKPTIEDIVHDEVNKFKGSISAEHGIGRTKARALEHYANPAKLSALKAIKTAMDPKKIVNLVLFLHFDVSSP